MGSGVCHWRGLEGPGGDMLHRATRVGDLHASSHTALGDDECKVGLCRLGFGKGNGMV